MSDAYRLLYIDQFAAKYYEYHPEKGRRYARRQARLRWATKQKRKEART